MSESVEFEVPDAWREERRENAELWYQGSSQASAMLYRRSKEDAIQSALSLQISLEDKRRIADAFEAFGSSLHATRLAESLKKDQTNMVSELKMPHFTSIRPLSILSCPVVDLDSSGLPNPIQNISFYDKLFTRALVSSLLTTATASSDNSQTITGTNLIFFDELQTRVAMPSSKAARLEAAQRSPTLLVLLNSTYAESAHHFGPEMEAIVDRLMSLDLSLIPHVIVLRYTPPPSSDAIEEGLKLRKKKKSAKIDLSSPSPPPRFPFDPSTLPEGHPLLTEEGKKRLTIIDLDFSVDKLPEAEPGAEDESPILSIITPPSEMVLRALEALREPLGLSSNISISTTSLCFHPKQAISSLLSTSTLPPDADISTTLTLTSPLSSSLLNSSLSPSMAPSASPMDPGASWAAAMQLPNPLCLIKPIEEWTIHDTQIWLQSMGKSISRHASRFMTLGVDGPMVLSLTDSTLKDLFKVDQKGRIQIMEALRTVQRGTSWIPGYQTTRQSDPLPPELISMSPRVLDETLLDIFRYYDRDSSDDLCTSELSLLLQASGLPRSSEDQARRILVDYDKDQDGRLNASEAMEMLRDLWRVLIATNDAWAWSRRGSSGLNPNPNPSALASSGGHAEDATDLQLLSIHTISSPRAKSLRPGHLFNSSGGLNVTDPAPLSPSGGIFGIPAGALPWVSPHSAGGLHGGVGQQVSFSTKSQTSIRSKASGLSESLQLPLIVPAAVAGKIPSVSLGGMGGRSLGGGNRVVFLKGEMGRPKGRHGKPGMALGSHRSWKEGAQAHGAGGDVWRSEGGGLARSKSELSPWNVAKSTVGGQSMMPWDGAKSVVGSTRPWNGAKSTIGQSVLQPWDDGAKEAATAFLPLTGSTLRAFESNPDLQPKSSYFSQPGSPNHSSPNKYEKKKGPIGGGMGGGKATRFGDEAKNNAAAQLTAPLLEQESENATASVALDVHRRSQPQLERLVFNNVSESKTAFPTEVDDVVGRSSTASEGGGGGGGGGPGGGRGDSFNRRGPRSHVSFIGEEELRPESKKGGRSVGAGGGAGLGLSPLKIQGSESSYGQGRSATNPPKQGGTGGLGGRGVGLPSGAASLVGTQAALAELDVFFEGAAPGGTPNGGTSVGGMRGLTDPQELNHALGQVFKLADLRRGGCLDEEFIRAALSFALPVGLLSPYEVWLMSSLAPSTPSSGTIRGTSQSSTSLSSGGGGGQVVVDISSFITNCTGAVSQWQSEVVRRVYGPANNTMGRPTTAASMISLTSRGGGAGSLRMSMNGQGVSSGPLTLARTLWKLYFQLRPLPAGYKTNDEGEIVGPADKGGGYGEVLGAPLSDEEAAQVLNILKEKAGGSGTKNQSHQGHQSSKETKLPFLIVAAINQEANRAVRQSGVAGNEVNAWSFQAAHSLHVYLQLQSI